MILSHLDYKHTPALMTGWGRHPLVIGLAEFGPIYLFGLLFGELHPSDFSFPPLTGIFFFLFLFSRHEIGINPNSSQFSLPTMRFVTPIFQSLHPPRPQRTDPIVPQVR